MQNKEALKNLETAIEAGQTKGLFTLQDVNAIIQSLYVVGVALDKLEVLEKEAAQSKLPTDEWITDCTPSEEVPVRELKKAK